MERTFVLIKPDAVERGLIGAITSRFEAVGLKILMMKMVLATREFVSEHYSDDEEWLRSVGRKTVDAYEKYGFDLKEELGTDDTYEVGRIVKGWLIDYVTSGPVVAMVLAGNHVVEIVRKIVGNTIPVFAEPGTIRGDFSTDSPDSSNGENRAVYNLIHASSDTTEAEREIKLWFGG